MNILNTLKKITIFGSYKKDYNNSKPFNLYEGLRSQNYIIVNYEFKIFQIFFIKNLIKDIINFKGVFIFIDSRAKVQQFINLSLNKFGYFPQIDEIDNIIITRKNWMFKTNYYNNAPPIFIAFSTLENNQLIKESMRYKIPLIAIFDELLHYNSFYKLSGNSKSLKFLYFYIVFFIKNINFYKNNTQNFNKYQFPKTYKSKLNISKQKIWRYNIN